MAQCFEAAVTPQVGAEILIYVAILRVAAEERADLIVMGVHGRNILDMTLFDSTANQAVRQATCPVLTLRQ